MITPLASFDELSLGQEFDFGSIRMELAEVLDFARRWDPQPFHIDAEAAAAGPFGAPIAHGFLTLSLIPKFFDQGIAIEGARMGVNYGLNRVRFTAPVPVGSRLRARLLLQAAERIEPDGMQMTWLVTVEREGSDKPVCVAESLARNYGAAA